jgi:hypothetical protein
MTNNQIAAVIIGGMLIAAAVVMFILSSALDARTDAYIKAAKSGYTADYPPHPDYFHGCVIGVIPGTNVLASVPAPKPSTGTVGMPIPCPSKDSAVFHTSQP